MSEQASSSGVCLFLRFVAITQFLLNAGTVGITFSLTDENLTARVPQPLFKMQRADLVLVTQSQP